MSKKVKYNKKEKRFIISCLLLIFLLIVALIIDFNLGVDKGKQKVIGKTQYTFNNVKRKYIDQIIWEDVDKGNSILDRDSINTGPDSSIKILLVDGTLIEIGENSLVLLEITEDDLTLNLTRGYLRTKRDKKNLKKDSSIKLVSKNKEIELKEGEVKLSKEKDKDIEVFVEKGEIDVNIDGKKKKITQGEKATLKEKTATIEKNIIKLVSPDDSKNYFISKKYSEIKFNWGLIEVPSPETKYNYILEISKNRNFEYIAKKIQSDNLNASVMLEKGTYFWRVSAKNIKSNKLSKSESRKISIIYNRPIKLFSPQVQSEFVYLTEKPTINFYWEEHEYATSYELEISVDKNFSKILKKIDSQAVRFSYQWESDMQVGETKVFYWRIKAPGDSEGWPGQVSSTQSFKLSKMDKLVEPNLNYPVDNQTIIHKVALKDFIIFKWTQSKEDLTSIMQISKFYNFKKIIHEQNTNENYWVMKKPFPVGTYYWRVKQRDRKGFESKFSRISSFQIIRIKNIVLVFPGDNSIHEIYDVEEDGLIFRWNKSNVMGRYFIEFSHRSDFKTEIYSEKITTPFRKIFNLKPGKIYWRVSLLDDEKNPIITSIPKTITVKNVLPDPDPHSPINYEKIEMLKRDDISFIWNKTKGANLYHIKLYKISDSKDINDDILIFDLKTKNLNHSFAELDKLDIGNFYWILQAMKIGLDGKIIRKSNEIRHSFSIDISELTSTKPEINILTPEVQVIDDEEDDEVEDIETKGDKSNEEKIEKEKKTSIEDNIGEQ